MADTFSNRSATKVWWKHWVMVLVLAVLAGLVIWLMIHLGPWFRAFQDHRLAQAIKRQAEQRFREDKYGGPTPEETYNMFIAALERGDANLASKFFVFNEQEQWSRTLAEYKNKDLLGDFATELRSEQQKWQPVQTKDANVKEFYYDISVAKNSVANLNGRKAALPSGTYTDTIRFEKYPSGIWKISVL